MVNILCYGDSNTFGLKSDLISRYTRSERWTGILQEALRENYYIIEEGLGGRTTVWDDPIENYKNGKTYLLPCLDSHKPLDLVIIMLGTNDLKHRFSLSCVDVAAGMENIIKSVLKSESGIDENSPEILLITPVPIRSIQNRDLDLMLLGAEDKSKELGNYYKKIAEKYHLYYLDPKDIVEVNSQDGIHYTVKGHKTMAEIVERKIRDIFEHKQNSEEHKGD